MRYTEKTSIWRWGQRLQGCFHVMGTPGTTWGRRRRGKTLLQRLQKEPGPWPWSGTFILQNWENKGLGNKHSLCLGWLCPPVHHDITLLVNTCQFSSVAQLCPTLCDPMDCSMQGFPVQYQLPEIAQTWAHRVGDAIQPSHPLSSPSPPAFNLSQQQGFFPMSQFFTTGGQSIRAAASALVLPMNVKDWFPLGWTDLVS